MKRFICRKCEYPLTGLTEPRCPECGLDFDPRDPDTYGRAIRQALPLRYSATALLLFFAELACAELAYHTIGEITSAVLKFIAWVGLFVVVAIMFLRLRLAGIVLAVVLALLIIPYQAWLGVRYVMLEAEAESIVAFAEETRKKTGAYPEDLSDYTYRFNTNRKHLQWFKRKPGEFDFGWYVGTPSTSHWYSSRTGWGYHPD